MNKLLKENITRIYGDNGTRWLNDIPGMVDTYTRLWGLENLKAMSPLYHNYVMAGFQGVRSIVLKLSPAPWELAAQAWALKAFAGKGAVKLLAQCEGALLLERLCPGHTLRNFSLMRETDAINIFCELNNKIHRTRPLGRQFLTINDWLEDLESDWDIPKPILYEARALKTQLLSSCEQAILLHGDLHHENILKDVMNWRAINPKGVIGEALYEAGAFIRNPVEVLSISSQAGRIIKFRILKIASILEADPQRLAQWSFVQAVLAWIWAIQRDTKVEQYESLAQTFFSCDLL